MKRFRAANLTRAWTRRSAILAAAGLTACGNTPASAQKSGGLALWPMSGPPLLRGAVIAQRRRRRSVDGDTFGGGKAVLPAYERADFDRLAEAGANLVVMSFPELWTVDSPWRRDTEMADALEQQLDHAGAAGLYSVVGLRSGPGRSDFVFHRDSAGSWFPAELIVDSIWRDADAQRAWTAMCVDAARMLKSRPEVAGLNLMVEPDPNVGGRNRRGGALGAWTPDAYMEQVGEISDWRRLAGDIARVVRAEMPQLPILISPPAFARTDFLPVMGDPPVEGVVWCMHDYEPRDFTHLPQDSAGIATFSEGGEHTFAQRLDRVMKWDAPVFLGEFGASRWASGVDEYHAARIAACEARGVAWAAFRWPTRDASYEQSDAMFNLLMGDGHGGVPAINALRSGWAKNRLRPDVARLRGRRQAE